MKKLLAILLSLVMVMCLFAACDSGDDDDEEGDKKNDAKSGCEAVIERVIQAQLGTISKSEFKKMYPAEVWEEMGFDESWERYQDNLETLKSSVEERFGEDVTYSITILDETKLSEDELNELKEAADDGTFDPDDMEDACRIDFESTIEGSLDSYTNTVEDSLFVCIRGEWYAYSE